MRRWIKGISLALVFLLTLTAGLGALAEPEATVGEPPVEELPEFELTDAVAEPIVKSDAALEPEETPKDGTPQTDPDPGPGAPATDQPPEGGLDAQQGVEAPRLNAESLTLGLNERFTLKLLGAEGVAFTYSTSKKKVATVSASGVITARKKGSAVITATASTGEQYACAVKVVSAPKKITLSARAITLGYDADEGIGASARLGVKLSKGSAGHVSFSGYDGNVVSVSGDGTITAVGRGTTTITAATFNRKKAKCKVTVLGAPDGLAFADEAPVLIERERRKLALNVSPSGSAALANYVSDNEAVASVNADTGEVTALAIGEATITATAFNGVTTSCKVTVRPGPDRIVLTAATVKLGLNERLLLDAVPMRGDDAVDDVRLVYASSKPRIVSVGADGTLTGKRRGTAEVTATAPNGAKAKCKVKVLKAPGSVKLSASLRALEYDPDRGVAETARLRVTLPKSTAGTVEFIGYDPAVVEVSPDGTVTPVGLGSTTVTARAFNGKRASCKFTVYAPGSRFNPNAVNVAHRGGAGYWMENTVEAFRNSASTGAKAIELDVRSTKDGAQVVRHDPDFTVDGRAYTIKKLTLAQLRRLNPSVCTLDEALDAVAASGLELVLELKNTADPKACVRAVKRHGLRERTLYISFNASLLKQVRKQDKSARLGFLINKTPSDLMKTLKSLNTKYILQNAEYLTVGNLIDWQDAGCVVGVWTPNNAEDIRKWLGLGVDYITSDYPKLITEALAAAE